MGSTRRKNSDKGPCGAGDEVLAAALERRRERPGNGEDVVPGGHNANAIAVAAKGEQRLDLVIAIGAPCADVEGQVDLGRRRLDDHRLAGNPLAILAAIRLASSVSA